MIGDLISRQAAIDALVKRTHLTWERLKTIYPMLNVFENLPPAERHGKWTTERTIEHDGEMYCDQCGWTGDNLTFDRTKVKRSPYCPNCGASMMDEVKE